jgi:hypothetical protein
VGDLISCCPHRRDKRNAMGSMLRPVAKPNPSSASRNGTRIGVSAAIEFRFAKGQDERLADLAAELVRGGVAMLVATDRHGANLLRPATS